MRSIKERIKSIKKHLKSIINFDSDEDDKIDIDKWNKHPQRLTFKGWKNEKYSK